MDKQVRQKYLLQGCTPDGKVLAINWGGNYPESEDRAEPGDCLVRAIPAETEVREYVAANHLSENTFFTRPLTIDQARALVAQGAAEKLGQDVNRCLGLVVEGGAKPQVVFFSSPIQVAA